LNRNSSKQTTTTTARTTVVEVNRRIIIIMAVECVCYDNVGLSVMLCILTSVGLNSGVGFTDVEVL